MSKDTDFNHGAKEKDPIITPEDIGKSGKITLVGGGREVESTWGISLMLPCRFKNKNYAWFVRIDSKNYAALYRQFGKNLSGWKGDVEVFSNSYLGKKYIEIVGSQETRDSLRAPASAFED